METWTWRMWRVVAARELAIAGHVDSRHLLVAAVARDEADRLERARLYLEWRMCR